jgi:hypothetical protein
MKVFQPATFTGAGPAARMHLLDVSATGALAHAHEPPARGARLRIECLGVARGATVKWSEGKRFGLLFDRPLTADEVDRLAAPVPASRRIAVGA